VAINHALEFDSRNGQKILVVSNTNRLALGHTQVPIIKILQIYPWGEEVLKWSSLLGTT